jgi:hypothetical protein
MKAKRIMKKQADWQASRKNLSWAKKIRMIERVRESWAQLTRAKRSVQRPGNA